MKYILEYNSFKETPFYIFGSEDSKDYDIIVSVDEIPQDIDKAHEICKEWNEKLSKILPDKPLNCNLGIFRNGKIEKVFKGTTDELTNCIYYTYNNHKQYFPNPIDKPIERDIDEKVLRVARFIITFYSRTKLRSEIKAALRGDLMAKLEVLKKIDFTNMTEFTGKKENPEDIYKVLAFQFGQIFSMIDGYEGDSYTKSGIKKNYSDLSNLLSRGKLSNEDLETLNKYLHRFVEYVEDNIDVLPQKEKIK